jgi:hypothetical protein
MMLKINDFVITEMRDIYLDVGWFMDIIKYII